MKPFSWNPKKRKQRLKKPRQLHLLYLTNSEPAQSLCKRTFAKVVKSKQMEKRKHHESTIERVRMVRAITEQHYESGNQARCYKAVWRQHIFPKFKICYRTYLNYLGIPTPPPVQQPQQLTLWDALNKSPAT